MGLCVYLSEILYKCIAFHFLQFLQQFRHYESNLQIFQLDPSNANKTLGDLVMFISQVGNKFKGTCRYLACLKILLMTNHSPFSYNDVDVWESSWAKGVCNQEGSKCMQVVLGKKKMSTVFLRSRHWHGQIIFCSLANVFSDGLLWVLKSNFTCLELSPNNVAPFNPYDCFNVSRLHTAIQMN